MKKVQILLFIILGVFLFKNSIIAQEDRSKILAATDVEKLNGMAIETQANFEKMRALALQKANEEGWIIRREFSDGTVIELMYLSPNGKPVYYQTNNADAAITTGTNELHNGGSLGLSLDGNGFTIGVWDEGKIRDTHEQFNGRVTSGDGTTGLSDHSTHVCGTLIGDGVANSSAKGMAPSANVEGYNWTSDVAEMTLAAASGMLISNHSYGTASGWFNDNFNYYWYGSQGTLEDNSFGRYTNGALQWDAIAEAAPYYLIVKSAGNDRDDVAPVSGTSYTYGDGTISNTSTDPHEDDCNDGLGYDCIPTRGTAKNILTVGAVHDIANYTQANDANITTFSGWGPTDDGRIKPDICGNGQALISSIANNNSSYGSASGTSMAAPNVAGSLALLQEHYQNVNGTGNFMRAATLKALVIHTANEAGTSAGPDYEFGWGVLNAEAAADLITENGTTNNNIEEVTLPNNGVYTKHFLNVFATSNFEVTIAWTDPAGTSFSGLDNSSSTLVNDLDIVVTDNNNNTYYPYVLDPANPANAATTGNNSRDNVEKVYISSSTAFSYTITVTHKGTLVNPQNFSIITNPNSDTQLSTVSGCRSTINTYPYSQGFEGGVNDWADMLDDDFDWRSETGATSTNQTGPTNAFEGDDYLYVEANNENTGDSAVVESPCFELVNSANVDDYLLTFAYHMYGSAMGTLDLEARTQTGSWSTIWTKSGDQGDSWYHETINLSSHNYLDSTVQFRFVGNRGSGNKSDIAIDYFKIEGIKVINTFPYQEGFETGLGDWTQDDTDDFDWTSETGATPTNNTGPTTAYEGAYYYYTEANQNNNSTATLKSPFFDLKNSTIQNAEVSFAYHMYGNHVGTLELQAQTSSNSWTTIWSMSGDQGDSWHTGTALLGTYMNDTLQLRFVGTTGSGGNKSDMAVDDVLIEEVSHTCHQILSTFPYQEGFENGIGDWMQDDSDDFDWTHHTGATATTLTGPTVAHEGTYYYYVEANSNHNDKAQFDSPCLNFKDANLQNAQVSFSYHMYGGATGTLKLNAKTASSTSWTTIWTKSSDQGDSWYRDTINLGNYINDTIQLRIVAEIANGNKSDIAIDNIVIEEVYHNCNEIITSFPYQEGFESGIGDWSQDETDDFDWTHQTGMTPTNVTGPDSASEGTYYYYIEADANNNNTANLNGPCLNLKDANLQNAQISFSYHMFGSFTGSLNLKAKTPNGTWTSIWSKSGNQGGWHRDTVNLLTYINDTLQLQFEGTIGGGNTSDIAIDDIVVEEVFHNCNVMISSFPHHESFESGLGDWVQQDNSAIDWTHNSGSTPSANTGPSAAYDGTYYYYTEATNFPTDKARLISPCFNLNDYNAVSAQFGFAYHMYGSHMGMLDLQVKTVNASSWTTLWTKSGSQGNSWQRDTVDLSSYINDTIKIRFRGIVGLGDQSDMAIDDVKMMAYRQGESCGTANQIATTGTYTANSPSSGNGCHNCTGAASNANWWSYTATGDGYIDISSCGSGVNTRLFVYEGTCDNLTQIANSDDACILSTSNTALQAALVEGLAVTSGQTYYIEWDDAWSNSGFDFDFSFYTCDDPTGLVETYVTYDSAIVQWNAVGFSTNYIVEWSSNGINWTSANVSSNTFTITNLTPNTSYQWRVKSECGSVFSDNWTTDNFSTLSLSILAYASENISHVLCNGQSNGSIDISFGGGVAPYTFSWSNGATTEDISNLSIGNYSCTITDALNQTTTSGTITVTEPLVINHSEVATNTSCFNGNDGSINLTISGGTTPYSYAWSNGGTTQYMTGLSSGSYTCTVTDANGCTYTTNSISISAPSAISTTETSTNISCFGGNDGSINLTPNGGTAPYTYAWSNGATTQNISSLSAGIYTCTVTDVNGCIFTTNGISLSSPSGISTTAISTNISCFGGSDGSINLTPNGGTAPYTYAWSNGATTQNISNLSAGMYTCTITDVIGCVSSTSGISLSSPSAISTTETSTNISCFGGNDGSINLTPNGGTAPYTYAWSNGATTQNISNLLAGAYTCTVTDANSCTYTTSSINVSAPSAISATETVINASCSGGDGSIDLTVTGGSMPYTYVWSNGATTQDISSLSAGGYTCTVTDANSCTYTTSNINITSPSGISITNTTTDVNCFGGNNGSINLTTSGGAVPYTYAWNNGATTQNVFNLSAGTYTCTITDANGCTYTTSSISISSPSAIFTTETATNTNCFGGNDGSINLTLHGGTVPYTYAWSNGATTQNISSLSAGAYTCIVTDANGCTYTTSSISISSPSAISATETSANASCFGGNDGSINLTSSGGTAPYTYAWSNGATTQNLASLSAGTYTCTVTDANGCTYTTSSISISSPSAISTTETVINASCLGGDGSIDLIVTGGSTPYTYAWSNGATTQDISSLSAGTYTCTVTDANGCTYTTTNINVSSTSGISVTNTTTDVNCFGGNNGSISLTPNGGTAPYTYSWSNGATTQNISNLSAGAYTCTITDVSGCTYTLSNIMVNSPSVISTTETVINTNCFGSNDGSINLTPNGGTAPYTYSWSNGATTQNVSNLSAGVYTCIVTDVNGCTYTTSSISISSPTAISTTETVINASCLGGDGSIDLTVTGGSMPYTYSWSNGATTQDISSLSAGTYTCAVTDANGCIYTTTNINVSSQSGISVANTITDVNCFGGNDGSIDLTPTGGTAPYTYAWNNGATTQNLSSLSAGAYVCTVTDANGCIYTLNNMVVNAPSAISTTEIVTNTNCFGGNDGSIDLTPNGGTAPYTYAWSNGATTQNISSLSAGFYNGIVTDANGCTQNTANVIISEPDMISLVDTIIVHPSNSVGGSIDITPTGGTAPYTYSWSTGETTEDIQNLSSGQYTLTITDANGCTENFEFEIFTVSTSAVIENDVAVSIYPNPVRANQGLTVEIQSTSSSDFELVGFNILGEQILPLQTLSMNGDNGQFFVETSNYNGLLILRLSHQGELIKVSKVMVIE